MLRDFQAVKTVILAKGDRQTYSNKYNHNPHLVWDEYDLFLNPEPGGPQGHVQWNINCDPAKSDFDVLVIRDRSSRYVRVQNNKLTNSLEFSYEKNVMTEAEAQARFMKIVDGVIR